MVMEQGRTVWVTAPFFIYSEVKMNRFSDEDIIAAISTAVGSAGIGIVRLSGQGCIPLVDTLFKNQAHKKLKDAPTQTMVYSNMVNPTTHQILDEVLVSVMRGPHTYTTQDVVEISPTPTPPKTWWRSTATGAPCPWRPF